MIQRPDIDEHPAEDAPEVDVEETPIEELPLGRRERMRRRILRSTALLPALFTVSNGLFGFASIHFATKDGLGAQSPTAMLNLFLAAWMILAAMVCDMLDGSVARLARKTSDFGGQLDSLSDVISFGVAPAVLMVHMVFLVLRAGMAAPGADHASPFVTVERSILCVAGVYMACAALRLARFNVENEPDESAHMTFSGLPSPGAAAALLMPILLLAYYCLYRGLTAETGGLLYWTITAGLPALALCLGLLMVSRLQYPHVINQYVRGKKPFSYLVKLVVIVLAAMLYPLETGAALAVFYALWGPIRSAVRMFAGRNRTANNE